MKRCRCILTVLMSVVMSVVMLGCGVPTQTTPQLVPTVAPPNSVIGSPLTSREQTVQLYFIRDTKLFARPQLVRIPSPSDPLKFAQAALDLLVKGPTVVERQNGIRSPVSQIASPKSPIVVSLALEGTVRVDLGSKLSGDLSAEDQILAYAQIVYTLTNLVGVGFGRVRFLADGKVTTVLTGSGIKTGEVFQGSFTCAERGDCDLSSLVALDPSTVPLSSTPTSSTTSSSPPSTTNPGNPATPNVTIMSG